MIRPPLRVIFGTIRMLGDAQERRRPAEKDGDENVEENSGGFIERQDKE